MKLINKTISYYLLISIPLLLIAGVFAYYRIQAELDDSTHESLAQYAVSSGEMIVANPDAEIQFIGFDSLSTIQIVPDQKEYTRFSDTMIYSNYEKEMIPFGVLRECTKFNGKTYLVTIYKSTLEKDDLMESLFSSFLLIIAFLILAFFIVSWVIAKKLWRPFYNTLSKLETYDIKQHHTYSFDNSSIKEFDHLNKVLNKMTDKLYSDFIQQKEFTENASHEMQTPLAVVKANLSLLMQSPNLKEEEMNHLQSIENTIKKLSALNKALILLSKIENHQFNENIPVNFNDKLKSTINHYQDLLLSKSLVIETAFDNELIVAFNPTLADVLITNLLQNAVRHNQDGGTIHISIKNKTLTISNSGEALSISKDELFTRFKKNDASKDSLGLGLSIVKSIASLYRININYNYLSNNHVFTLAFNSEI